MTNQNEDNPVLYSAESGIQDCENFERCNDKSGCGLTLSKISPGAKRRGSRQPKIALVTEAPDQQSREGTAYSGSISNRIISVFCDEKYGISLNTDEDQSFSEFLTENKIYATSAVKCAFSNQGSFSDYVISKCRELYLDNQINAIDDLQLIVPMGQVAATSVLHRTKSSVNITELIGMRNQGLFGEHPRYEVPVAVLPHPSGNNPYANPPVISANTSPDNWEYVVRFRRALTFIRDVLDELDYDVLAKSPSSWDLPPGLSDFQ